MKKRFTTVQIKNDVLIREHDKRYIMQFKIKGLNWVFALPLKTMYLQTIEGVKEDIQNHIKNPQNKGIIYRIAEIIN